MSVIGNIDSSTKVMIVDPSDLTIADSIGSWSSGTVAPAEFVVNGSSFGTFSMVLDGNLLVVNDVSELQPNTGNSATGKSVLTAKADVEQWEYPTILLSNVKYDILDSDGNIAKLYGKSLTGIWFIPITYYMKLSAGSTPGCYDSGTPLVSAKTFLCNKDADVDYCKSYANFEIAWTTISDCEAGNTYTYRPSGNTCGTTSGCRAICENDQRDSCVYDGNTGYSCKLDVEKAVTSEPLLQQTWFLLLILGIVVMIIVILVIILIGIIAFKHMS